MSIAPNRFPPTSARHAAGGADGERGWLLPRRRICVPQGRHPSSRAHAFSTARPGDRTMNRRDFLLRTATAIWDSSGVGALPTAEPARAAATSFCGSGREMPVGLCGGLGSPCRPDGRAADGGAFAACRLCGGPVERCLRRDFQSAEEPVLPRRRGRADAEPGWADAWTSMPSVYAVAAERTEDVVAAVNLRARTGCGWSSRAAATATRAPRTRPTRCWSGRGA